MRVLLAASECAPLVKTGGLADVIGALPAALAPHGVETRVLLPGYPAVMAALAAAGGGIEVARPEGLPGGPARVLAATVGDLPLLVLDAPRHYDRPTLYEERGRDWPDNHLRFGALSRAAAILGREGAGGWVPDVLHLHDWQTALAPVWLEDGPRPATVVTIHNIAYQGLFPPSVVPELGLPPAGFTQDGYEFWGQVGFLKAGLALADRITTVSPGYAREILTPEFGNGLEGLLLHRRAVLSGILNGADTTVWDPETDPHLPATYSARAPAAKQASRAALAARFGLREGPGPVLVVVSRLARQKGLDLLIEALPGFLARGGRFALLGSGDAALEAEVRALAAARPGEVGVETGYDEALSHLLYAGGDAIAVPSRFEPCGLTQLYGLRYGTLPLVARTGGLGDTVIDANPAAIAAGCATGFVFAPVTAPALSAALDRLLDAWADRALWRTMMRRAMTHPVGWDRSAAAYAALYADAAAARR